MTRTTRPAALAALSVVTVGGAAARSAADLFEASNVAYLDSSRRLERRTRYRYAGSASRFGRLPE